MKLGKKGQLNIESLITIVVGLIMYIVIAAYVFGPIYDALSPALENEAVTGSYGALASTMLLIIVYLILPLLLIASAFMLLRPRYEIQQ